jgi:hypothetical protein
MKMYKGFNSDWSCRGHKFEFGKKYTINGSIEMCGNGWHCCEKINDVFTYYDYDENNKFAIVELTGNVEHGDDGKSVGEIIELIEEISWVKVKELANIGKNNTGHSNSGDSNSGHRNSGHRNSGDSNSGDWNSGHRNSGDRNSGDSNSGHRNSGHSNSGHSNSGHRNSGHRNSGHRNSGHSNSGDWNSGDWNSCNYENGFFNSKQSEFINVFNKSCKIDEWDKALKPSFIYNIYLTKWVDFENMTEEQQKEDADAYFRGGYLKKFTYKEAWLNAYKEASKEDIELLKALPNFDSEVFKEITGIRIED